jgi:hypothetical protein
MSRLQYFAGLADQVSSALAYYWPVTLALLGLNMGVVMLTLRRRRQPIEPRLWWSLSPLCLSAVILLFGALFEESARATALDSSWPVRAVYALLFAHFPVAILLVSLLRGFRWLAAAVSALITWVSVWAAAVSVMSITGNWL